jgi:hypothetical protein
MANENMSDWNITLDQFAEQVREEVRKTVDKYFDFLQKTVSSYPLGDTELARIIQPIDLCIAQTGVLA